jgi:hypothetical protein
MFVLQLPSNPCPNKYSRLPQRQHGLRIVALSDDYLNPTQDVFSWRLEGGNRVEAPAMVKLGGTYYLFASMMTGWDSNDNQYTTATNLRGPWSPWRKFADSGSNVSLLSSILSASLTLSNILPTDLQLPNHLHPENQREQRHLHGRPLGQGQPDG